MSTKKEGNMQPKKKQDETFGLEEGAGSDSDEEEKMVSERMRYLLFLCFMS